MVIENKTEQFFGKTIEEFDASKGIIDATSAHRLSVDYDEGKQGKTLVQLFEKFITDPQASKVQALVIGPWENCNETPCQSFLDKLIEHKTVLPNLKALFVSDMTSEDCEISEIQQGNYAPLLKAFPELEMLQIRGSQNLRLGTFKHTSLKSLIIETGGLDLAVLESLIDSYIPNLEHLELWLGSFGYGCTIILDDVIALFQPRDFPNLTYLGLRNSEISDELAEWITEKGNPLLAQLKILDLSLGTLGDEGASALLSNPHLEKLEKLDLHHHFMSDSMVERFQQLNIDVDVSEQEEEEDDEYGSRYISVSE